jgi:hypothetical protein
MARFAPQSSKNKQKLKKANIRKKQNGIKARDMTIPRIENCQGGGT